MIGGSVYTDAVLTSDASLLMLARFMRKPSQATAAVPKVTSLRMVTVFRIAIQDSALLGLRVALLRRIGATTPVMLLTAPKHRGT